MPWSRRCQTALILTAFAVAAFLAYRPFSGDDLSSSYIGCRVIAAHQEDHLYRHSSKSFDQVDDPVWVKLAAETGFGPGGVLHPYVQTPLWGIALQPLCARTGYRAFHAVFLGLEAACFAGLLWIAASVWAPEFLRPRWMALIALLFFVSVPVRYSLLLAQTHVFFVLLTLLALVLARKYPMAAGILLALAAAVKITPAAFLVYWLIVRRNKAALSFVAASALLAVATFALAGRAEFAAYLDDLHGASKLLLVSANNQSFPAWLMGYFYPASELNAWNPHALPDPLKLASAVLALAAAAAGGLMDRKDGPAPGCGAIFVLIGATMFTSIAWSHYYFILLIPVLMLAASWARERSRVPFSIAAAMLVAILVLNLIPHRIMQLHLHLVRPQFYSGVLALAGLVLLRVRAGRRTPGFHGPYEASEAAAQVLPELAHIR